MQAFTGFLFRIMVSQRTRIFRGMSFLLAVMLLLSGIVAPLPAQAESLVAAPQAKSKPGQKGMAFLPNAGQTDANVRFETQAFGGSVYFTENEVVLALPGSEVSMPAVNADEPKANTPHKTGSVARLHFEGAGRASIRAEEPQPGVVNILLGSDKKQWFTGLRTYSALTYTGLFPGVDLRYEGTDGSLKGTYQVAAGADPAKIRWSYQGAKDVTIDAQSGSLLISLAGGQLMEKAPVAWQDINGKRVPVSAHYELSQGKSVGFSLGSYDKSLPLTIDPTLIYSTYLGGSGADRINTVSVDPVTGQIFVAGETSSVPFPGSSLVDYPIYPNMFVAQLNPDGSSVYRTILGGSNADYATAISAYNGIAAVAGYTYSSDFPGITNTPGNTYQSGADMTVLTLSATGTEAFARVLGSENLDMANGVALQGSKVYVTGVVDGILASPTCAPATCTPNGGTDVVVAAYDTATNALIYAVQFGGFFGEVGRAIALDGAGNAYVTGSTSSTGASGTAKFPTLGAYQAASGGGQDAFIVKIDPTGATKYSSFLGGSSLDEGRGIAVDSAGSTLYLTGRTQSANFPAGAATLKANGVDAFVMKFNLAGNTVSYSKLIGGNGTEAGSAVVADASGTVFITGSTSTTPSDASNPFGQALGPGGNNDAFAVRLDSSGVITYNTRLGGTSDDFGTGVGVYTRSDVENIYVGGYTNSNNFPIVTPTGMEAQSTYGGSDDGFLAVLANSLPVLDLNDSDPTNGIDYSTTFTEGGTGVPGSGPVVLSSGLSVTDIDNTLLAYARVSFAAARPDGANETLNVNLDTANTGISGSFNAATGVMSLTGSSTTTLANWAAVLGSITYDNSADAPTPGGRQVNFEVNDGLNSNVPLAVATVTVIETNDAPVLTVPANGVVTIDEDTFGPVSGISVADPDAGAGVLDLTLTVPVEKGTLTATKGLGNGTVTISASGDSVLMHGTLDNITKALATLQFQGVTDFNGVVTVTAVLNDNGNTGTPATPQSDTKSFDITVAAVNDNPVATSPATVDATENTARVIRLIDDLGLNDSKDTSAPATPGATAFVPVKSITITTPPDASKGTIDPLTDIDINAGTITYHPKPGINGTDTFIYQVCDLGTGKGTGCTTQTVNVVVSGVNDPPSFTGGPNLPTSGQILEDSPTFSYPGWASALSAGPSDESGQLLHFNVSNNNPGLFKADGQPDIKVNGSMGDLTFTPAPNANGIATVTVTLQDSGTGTNTSAPQTFTITITPVNDQPTFGTLPAVTVNEDNPAQTLINWMPGISTGPADEAGQKIIAASIATVSGDPAIFSVYPTLSVDGTLSFTPAGNAHGTITLKAWIQDDGSTANGGMDTSAEQTFTLTINSVNDAPSFTGGVNINGIPEDSAAQTIANWASGMLPGPADESGQAMSFNVSTSRNEMFSVLPAVDASTGTLTFTPAANANGTVSVTVTLQDQGGTLYGGVDTSAPYTFTITIVPANDAPVGPASVSKTTNQDTALNLTVGGLGVTDQIDTYWSGGSFGISDLTPKVAPAHGTLNLTLASAAIIYTPITGYAGTDSFTYTVCDNGVGNPIPLCFDQTINVTVNGVNDPPTFTKGADLGIAPALVLEDGGHLTFPGWATAVSAGPSDESAQTLKFIVTNNNNALFTLAGQPKITPNGTLGDLDFTLAPDANGIVTVFVKLQDNGGGSDTSAQQSFTITITAVNDQPSFTKGADQFVIQDSGSQTVAGWATNIKRGPWDEGSQKLQFIASSNNPALFSVQPSVDPATGNLTYTPAAGKHGTATVKLTLKDDGGILNGGVDTSVEQTFVITVGAVNDLSVSVSGGTDPILTGFSTDLMLTATNANDAPATGVKFTFTLPADLLFDSSSDPACTAAGQDITCTLGTIPANNGTGAVKMRVKVNPYMTADKTITFKVNVAGDQPDPVMANNQADATVNGIYKIHWYQHDFSTFPGAEWSNNHITTAPKGQLFLGEFNNQTITLHFDNVPEHGQIQVSFDLYIIRSWDGNQWVKFANSPDLAPNAQTGSSIGPDMWEFQTDGQVLMRSTFTNWPNLVQSYPAWYPLEEHPYNTGATASGTLGYIYNNMIVNMDSIYHITRTVDHNSSTLTFTFRDLGLQELSDESWGIDNITVDLLGANPEAKKLFFPAIAK